MRPTLPTFILERLLEGITEYSEAGMDKAVLGTMITVISLSLCRK